MNNSPWREPTTLTGQAVTLRPLQKDHGRALVAAAGDGELWNLWYTTVPAADTVAAYIDFAFAEQELGHACAIAVEFRTHWHNQASRSAIAHLGAKQDGVLRNHQQMADGSYRDTVVFSIINHEWLAVKASLTHKLHPRT